MANRTAEGQELMSVLGHELRTPLTAIRAAASLLLEAIDELPTDKVRTLLEVIDKQSGRMADRIDDVLVAGRIDGDRLRVMDEAVDLAEAVAEVVEAARSQAPARRIRVQGVVEPVLVRADPERATQVLRILIENALRFSPSHAPVEVRVQRPRAEVRVEVRDRGPGIPAGDRERVFERGAKVDPGGPGAGLGLYVVRGLVTAMGGACGCDARPGGGTAIWFTLPGA